MVQLWLKYAHYKLKKVMESLDGAIHQTLRLIGIEGDTSALVFLVRDELYKEKYLLSADDALPKEHVVSIV